MTDLEALTQSILRIMETPGEQETVRLALKVLLALSQRTEALS